MIPKSTPKQTLADTLKILSKYPLRKNQPVTLLAVRGYYKDTMGAPGRNDRGIYDDALFVISPDCFVAFNWNTDPSRVRKGRGKGAGKGMASLKAGYYPDMWKIGHHKKIAKALRQFKACTVIRDGLDGDYEDTGIFYINGHPGGRGTSSEGCQTAPPVQWPALIALVQAQLKKHKQDIIPYILEEA